MNRPLRLAVCFVGHFVGVRWVFRVFSWAFRGMFATLSQSVSSCRGGFIVPAYMKTPTKRGMETHI